MKRVLIAVLTAIVAGCCHTPPDPGGPGVRVAARDRYTSIGRVRAGQAYTVIARGGWRDWLVCTDARGFDSIGIMRWYEAKRRQPEARWFALVGVVTVASTLPVNDRDSLVKPINLTPYLGTGHPWVAPVDGTLFVFANDMPSMYGNNHGVIRIHLDPVTGGETTPH